MSLDPEDVMSVLALQAVQAVPESLLLIDSPAADIGGKAEDAVGAGALFLNIGACRCALLCQGCCSLHPQKRRGLRERGMLHACIHAC